MLPDGGTVPGRRRSGVVVAIGIALLVLAGQWQGARMVSHGQVLVDGSPSSKPDHPNRSLAPTPAFPLSGSPERVKGDATPVFGKVDCQSSWMPSTAMPTEHTTCPLLAQGVVLTDFPPCTHSVYERAYSGNGIFGGSAHRAGSYCAPPVRSGREALCAAVPEIDAVYMIHYTGEKGSAKARNASACRRQAMDDELVAQHVQVDLWVSALDREELDSGALKCLYSQFDAATFSNPAKQRRHAQRAIEKLESAQVSVNAKHHLALYDIVRSGRRMGLIIEDDVLLRAQFLGRLQEVVDSLRVAGPPRCAVANATTHPAGTAVDFGVAMIGGCMRLHGYRRKYRAEQVNPHVYRKQEARCAHAYLVTNAGAAALLQGMPTTAPIDFQITRAVTERNVSTIWVEPYLVVQGSFPSCGGECVTSRVMKKSCVSVEPYSREYDKAYKDDIAVCKQWDAVPLANSLR